MDAFPYHKISFTRRLWKCEMGKIVFLNVFECLTSMIGFERVTKLSKFESIKESLGWRTGVARTVKRLEFLVTAWSRLPPAKEEWCLGGASVPLSSDFAPSSWHHFQACQLSLTKTKTNETFLPGKILVCAFALFALFALLPFCPFCPFCPFALLTFCSFCPYAILSFTFWELFLLSVVSLHF